MAVFTRAALRATGMSDSRLRTAVRSGAVVRVGHDRYVEPGSVCPREAVLAAQGTGVALGGPSAARMHGLPAADERIHVVVRNGGGQRLHQPGVVVRQTRDWEAENIAGVTVTPLARTLVDVARELPLQESVPILDAGLRAGVQSTDLVAGLVGRSPGNARARRAIGLADKRAESPLESLLRLALVLGELPPDDLQHHVREEGRAVARVDLWYPGLVVEADGFDFHRNRADYRADRRKGQAYARLGLLLLRFSWEDVSSSPDAAVATVRATLRHCVS